MSDENGAVIIELLQNLSLDVRDIRDSQRDTEAKLDAHVAEEMKDISRFMEAFPDGPEKHREAHQAMIDAENEQAKFWRELRLDLAKKGVWGIFIILVGLVVAGIATKLGIQIAH